MHIRVASPADSHQMAEIYAPIVEATHISFELEPPSPAELAERAAKAHVCLVAETDGRLHGYAYGGRYREKPAYAWSTETTIYVQDGSRGTGVGRRLYRSLLRILAAQNFRRAFAGIALPNDASIRLHEAVGFERVGVNPEAGFKFGRWHDLGWWSTRLNDRELPDAPLPLAALGDLKPFIEPSE
jgi:phosphinothricin acetyltransferase